MERYVNDGINSSTFSRSSPDRAIACCVMSSRGKEKKEKPTGGKAAVRCVNPACETGRNEFSDRHFLSIWSIFLFVVVHVAVFDRKLTSSN